MQTVPQQKRWTLKLRAKAKKLNLGAKWLFPCCIFSMFRKKVFKKKAVVISLKTAPGSVVQKSKFVEYKIFKILKKLRIKRTKNKDTGAGMNARSERLSYKV